MILSRIGKLPVKIPSGVTVSFQNNVLVAKGKLGELKLSIDSEISIVDEGSQLVLKPANDDVLQNEKNKKLLKIVKQKIGLFRSLTNNLLVGVSQGFTKEININGVGWKPLVDKLPNYTAIKLTLGYSHAILVRVPEGITVTVPDKTTSVLVSGIDKQKVGQFTSLLCSLRAEDPYKGKGIRVKGAFILRKETKK